MEEFDWNKALEDVKKANMEFHKNNMKAPKPKRKEINWYDAIPANYTYFGSAIVDVYHYDSQWCYWYLLHLKDKGETLAPHMLENCWDGVVRKQEEGRFNICYDFIDSKEDPGQFKNFFKKVEPVKIADEYKEEEWI